MDSFCSAASSKSPSLGKLFRVYKFNDQPTTRNGNKLSRENEKGFKEAVSDNKPEADQTLKHTGRRPDGGRVEQSNLFCSTMCIPLFTHFKTKLKLIDVSSQLTYIATFKSLIFFLKLIVFGITKAAHFNSTKGDGNDLTPPRQKEKDSKKHILDEPVANTNSNKQHLSIAHNHAFMNETNKNHR